VIVEHLGVAHVRNVESAALDLGPGLNLFVGANGAGKTAVLEAAHVLLRGRSFRTNRISTVITHSAERLTVRADCVDEVRGTVRVGISKNRSNQTELTIDGSIARQTSAIAALLPVQLLLPTLSELVFGAPSERRQWLDWGTFHVKRGYLTTLRDYARALRQRNALLKSGDVATLGTWTQRLVELGNEVDLARRGYLAEVQGAVKDSLKALAPELELEFEYAPGFSGDSFAEELGRTQARDVKLGSTQAGPHRADVRLRSERGLAAHTVSRGQGKILASALRLGQARGLLEGRQRLSLFLIDDVGAELDDANSHRFFGQLSEMGCQILATSTHRSAFEDVFQRDRIRVFHVKHGEVTLGS
jgi:DNA replication and repair protein RecF